MYALYDRGQWMVGWATKCACDAIARNQNRARNYHKLSNIVFFHIYYAAAGWALAIFADTFGNASYKIDCLRHCYAIDTSYRILMLQYVIIASISTISFDWCYKHFYHSSIRVRLPKWWLAILRQNLYAQCSTATFRKMEALGSCWTTQTTQHLPSSCNSTQY